MALTLSSKQLLAAAISSIALASVSFTAHADPSGPNFYGKINVSLDHFNTEGASLIAQGKTKSTVDQWQLNSNASRLGVKGAFDLDQPGLIIDQAVYQAEYEINADDGSAGDTAFTQRNIFAGLGGNFGLVTFGKFDTPLKTAEGKVDQFNDLPGDFDILIGGQNRVNNIVQYASPKIADLVQINAAVIPAEGTDVDKDGKADNGLGNTVSTSVVFDNQTIYGALAYDKNQAARRSLDGLTRADIVRAVGTVKQGPLEAGVLLQKAEDTVANSDKADTSYLLSAAWNIDRFKIKGEYGSTKANVSNEKGKLINLGVDYSLAKKSAIYAYWTSADLDKANVKDKIVGVGFTQGF